MNVTRKDGSKLRRPGEYGSGPYIDVAPRRQDEPEARRGSDKSRTVKDSLEELTAFEGSVCVYV